MSNAGFVAIVEQTISKLQSIAKELTEPRHEIEAHAKRLISHTLQ